MDHFWSRYNAVVLENKTLKSKSEKHKIENKQLRSVLKDYLQQLTVSDDAVKSALLLVNQASKVTPPQKQGKHRPVVDGVQASKWMMLN